MNNPVFFVIFLTDFNQIWDSSISFYKRFKSQILRKYDQNEGHRFKFRFTRT